MEIVFEYHARNSHSSFSTRIAHCICRNCQFFFSRRMKMIQWRRNDNVDGDDVDSNSNRCRDKCVFPQSLSHNVCVCDFTNIVVCRRHRTTANNKTAKPKRKEWKSNSNVFDGHFSCELVGWHYRHRLVSLHQFLILRNVNIVRTVLIASIPFTKWKKNMKKTKTKNNKTTRAHTEWPEKMKRKQRWNIYVPRRSFFPFAMLWMLFDCKEWPSWPT